MEYQPVLPGLALLYRVSITVDAPQLFGPTPQAAGERRIINITGGQFSGARLSGRVPVIGITGLAMPGDYVPAPRPA